MNTQTFICYRYSYNVKYLKSGFYSSPKCKWPREIVHKTLRKPFNIYNEESSVKTITYPTELCYNEVEPNDHVEQMVIYIKNTFPEWVEIEVNRINEDNFLKSFKK